MVKNYLHRSSTPTISSAVRTSVKLSVAIVVFVLFETVGAIIGPRVESAAVVPAFEEQDMLSIDFTRVK